MTGKIKILHLEDSEDDALLIGRFLKKARHKVSIRLVENGVGFRQALETEKWDIILSDYALPDYSGMDAVELVKSMGIDTPVILVSGAIGEETAIELMHKGASDYIMKENLSRLLPAIERELLEVRFRKKSRKTDAAMQSMVKSIVGTTGRECFEKTLTGLCEWVGVESGAIGKIRDDHIHTVFCIMDGKICDNFQYPISGSPCRQVIQKGFSIYPQKVAERFPGDNTLKETGMESYVGVQLKSYSAEPVGVLCVFSKRKLKIPAGIKEYMEIVSAKIASEIERQNEEERRLTLERKLRQAQKMESIGTLAGGIAHDFNNILFPILGYAQMMMDDLAGDSLLRENLKEILTGAERAKDLVNQILAFSRQSDQEMKPLKVQLIIKEVLKLIRSSLPTTIEIKHAIRNDCRMVMADYTQIHQIAMNLITNAYHAMEDTGGILTVSLEEVNPDGEDLPGCNTNPGGYVCLTVSDTGIGMDQGIVDQIFDPYFTTKISGKGTGLGLSVVHGIVKSHGGDISVTSMPGKGSEFKVYLPGIHEETDAKESEKRPPLPGGKERILLVDDERQIITLVKQILERLGYHVTAIAGSVEALDTFASDPKAFDLVITDMTMPGMTGVQLSKQILAIRPEMPVILCTGFSEKMSEEKTKVIGIKAFLLKPVSKSQIAQMVRKVLDEAQDAD